MSGNITWKLTQLGNTKNNLETPLLTWKCQIGIMNLETPISTWKQASAVRDGPRSRCPGKRFRKETTKRTGMRTSAPRYQVSLPPTGIERLCASSFLKHFSWSYDTTRIPICYTSLDREGIQLQHSP